MSVLGMVGGFFFDIVQQAFRYGGRVFLSFRYGGRVLFFARTLRDTKPRSLCVDSKRLRYGFEILGMVGGFFF